MHACKATVLLLSLPCGGTVSVTGVLGWKVTISVRSIGKGHEEGLSLTMSVTRGSMICSKVLPKAF